MGARRIIIALAFCGKYGSNSIGQALGYAYRMKEYYGKEIELIIAGPNEQTESEHDVIDFLRRQIVLPISYLKIVYNPLDT